ncbi:hypothetical protein [Kitasatospora sp. NPDC015120]|uniref:hypothetical protein n=1 Tax=Kitasatospora sp. NPDC015120 TaxID=3364023 RepID=UPI0036F4A849
MSDTDLEPVTRTTPAATHETPADPPENAAVEPAADAEAPSTHETPADVGEVLYDAVQYAVIVTQLAIAAVRLGWLSEQVTGTYQYVENCARSVQRLADQAAGMNVDRDTIAEHRDAATVMLSVLDEAEALAAATKDLATAFQATADAHEADYGPVDEAAANKEGEMAAREFYANR